MDPTMRSHQGTPVSQPRRDRVLWWAEYVHKGTKRSGISVPGVVYRTHFPQKTDISFLFSKGDSSPVVDAHPVLSGRHLSLPCLPICESAVHPFQGWGVDWFLFFLFIYLHVFVVQSEVSCASARDTSSFSDYRFLIQSRCV